EGAALRTAVSRVEVRRAASHPVSWLFGGPSDRERLVRTLLSAAAMLLRGLMAALLVGFLVSTGCSTEKSPASSKGEDGHDASVGTAGRRVIPDDVLSRKAICYSGYRRNQSPETRSYPSEQEIKEDLDLLTRGGWTFLRLFDCSPHAERV